MLCFNVWAFVEISFLILSITTVSAITVRILVSNITIPRVMGLISTLSITLGKVYFFNCFAQCCVWVGVYIMFFMLSVIGVGVMAPYLHPTPICLIVRLRSQDYFYFQCLQAQCNAECQFLKLLCWSLCVLGVAIMALMLSVIGMGHGTISSPCAYTFDHKIEISRWFFLVVSLNIT